MAFTFTDDNFENEALSNKGVVVIDFWAEWCGPCRLVTPTIEQMATEFGDTVKVGKLNIDDNSNTTNRYQIRSIPTILILKDGEVVDRHVGVITPAALREKITMHTN